MHACFYLKLGFLGKNRWLKFGFWFTLRLRLKQLVWCILISFTDSCNLFLSVGPLIHCLFLRRFSFLGNSEEEGAFLFDLIMC